MRPAAIALSTALALASSVASPWRALAQVAPSEPVPTPTPSPEDSTKAAARAHFDQGMKLLGEDAWDAALAEFLATRALAPTVRNATNNAARCLYKLQRYDEALDMYEALLREFPDQSEADRLVALREVVALRGLVGTIDVTSAEIGASLVVDGRPRGNFPALAPLRVGAGSHAVRVFKEGFEPFDARVDVAGGQTVRLDARLRPLAAVGRLRVEEQRGGVFEVLVDGNRVGQTPWEGPLSPGEHTIALRGSGRVGSPPASVPVVEGKTTPLRLAVEELRATLRIEPSPVNALVSLDGVSVGRGVFEANLREGAHRVEVAADGFVAKWEDVSLAPDKRRVLPVVLERDLDSPLWRRPSRFVVDVTLGAVLAPSLGGALASTCAGSCDRGLGLGALGLAHGGYELGSGFGFGVAAGYLALRQTSTARPTALTLQDPSPAAEGTVNDEVVLQGLLAGAFAALAFGDAPRLHLRLGAGALLGSVDDTREGAFTSATGIEARFDAVTSSRSATYVFVAPDARVGFPLGEHAELTAGLGALVLFAVEAPRWSGPKGGVYGAVSPKTGYFAAFPDDTLTGSVIVSAVPELGFRYAR